MFVPEESSILLPVIKGAREGGMRRGLRRGGNRGRGRESVNIKRNAQRSDNMEEERSDAYEKQRRNSTAGITSCPRSSPFWKEGCDLFSSLGSETESRQVEVAVRIFQVSLELFIQDAHFNDRH